MRTKKRKRWVDEEDEEEDKEDDEEDDEELDEIIKVSNVQVGNVV